MLSAMEPTTVCETCTLSEPLKSQLVVLLRTLRTQDRLELKIYFDQMIRDFEVAL